MTSQAETASQDIQTKYDEFQKACKTILPKVDRKLIQDFLFRQQEDPDAEMTPRYTLEVITKEGLDTQKMKDLAWDKFGEMPEVDHKGTYYRIDHTLTLGMLKRISDHDSVLSVKGSYSGPV
jgi:fructose 1,6-bisphosphatase